MSKPVSRSRRATLPGASELFRGAEAPQPKPTPTSAPTPTPPEPEVGAVPAPSGRVKHDQKITVYFSTEELFALEEATLDVRRRLGRSLDRGRMVRTAVALALQGLAADGDDSAIVKALRED